jgi:hypothetical protein
MYDRSRKHIRSATDELFNGLYVEAWKLVYHSIPFTVIVRP